MVVFECWACEGDDGTLEVAPFPESARFVGFDQSQDVVDVEVEASSAESAS